MTDWAETSIPAARPLGRPVVSALLLILVALCPPAALAAEDDLLRIQLQEGQSLRDLAEQHLGDPDLWAEILRLNGLTVADVRPGIELAIPVGQVAAANRALDEALQRIQSATEQGARLFAAEQIAQAISLRDAAVAQRKAGEWDAAAKLATDAMASAEEALAAALAQRDATAEALLSDRQGWVEGQRPQDLLWADRALNTVLIEEEKVRTLSRSTAQITFRDDSRLRLNANSQAVIQRMRVDPLSREEEAKVSLIEGDFYALLAGRSERKSFELEIPEVETEIESTNFWVRRDVSGSKFANYDERLLQVSAQGESVSLGRNEAALVRSGAAPSEKIDVLAAPALRAPGDDQVAFDAELQLSWATVADAAGYWLEVAGDPGFERMTYSRWGLADGSYQSTPLEVGSYYWRVAALDKFGLPGERSEVWRFHVRADATPPYLSIGAPGEGGILRQSPVELRGESEPEVALELDGQPLEVDADGRFQTVYAARPGLNQLTIKATDTAGNVTERSRSFVYMPDEHAAVVFDQALARLDLRHFVTAGDAMSLSGQTSPNAQIVVRAADGAARVSAYADGAGRFGINVPMQADDETFAMEVIAPSGFASQDQFEITVDRTPPRIAFEAPPPSVTAIEWLPLRGQVEGGIELLLDGAPAQLIDEAFDQTVTLQQGANHIELVASDLVGNVGVEKLEIFLDQEPPQLVRQSVTRSATAGGAAFTVDVVANDASGLTQAAPFTLRVGDRSYDDFLRYNPASQSYRATVVVPGAAASAPAALEDVELEDYAGNQKRYIFK
jgi:FecR protein/Glucodextranase, domain B